MRLIVLDRSPYGDPADARSDELLREAAAARGIDAVVVTFRAARDPALAAVRPDDVVLVRADLRSDEDLVVTTQALWDLGRRGVRCLPAAEGLVAAADRLRTFVRLRHAGVPTPSTVALCATGPRLGDLAAFHGRMNAFPCIVKRPVRGRLRSVWRCDDAAELSALLERERGERPEGAVLVQPLLAHDYVLRVFAAGGRVLSATRRAVADARIDGSAARAAVEVAPGAESSRAALAALGACGLSFGAVDFLEAEGTRPTCFGVDALPLLDPPDLAHRAAAEAFVGCALAP